MWPSIQSRLLDVLLSKKSCRGYSVNRTHFEGLLFIGYLRKTCKYERPIKSFLRPSCIHRRPSNSNLCAKIYVLWVFNKSEIGGSYGCPYQNLNRSKTISRRIAIRLSKNLFLLTILNWSSLVEKDTIFTKPVRFFRSWLHLKFGNENFCPVGVPFIYLFIFLGEELLFPLCQIL